METDTDIGTDEQPLIHGDVLDAILSNVPLIHLIPASHVSKTWSASVSSAFRKSTPKPWLILHTQHYLYRYPYPTTTHAYDPDSNSWIQIHAPPTNHISTLRSSHSNLLYTLSPTHLSFSFDPLHLTWHHAPPPKVSRIDPIVAVVGRRVVVAGGAFDFEDDPLAVELYDLHSHHWTKSDPMPFFNQSNSSIWLSVASNDPHLFIMEKSSGITYSFDTNNNNWYGPYDLRPDRRVFSSVIGLLNNKLIVVGVLGEGEHVEGVKVWEVDDINNSFEWKLIGEMPESYVEDMKSCDDDDDDDDDEVNIITLVDVVMAGNVVYMCVCLGVEVVNIIVCEVVEGGGCRWRRVVNCGGGGGGMEKVVVTCSMVGMDELERAGRLENRRFVVKR